jgi:hypothetical protein
MAKKTFKIAIGTNTRFVRLDEAYEGIKDQTGIEPVVAGDLKQGDYPEKAQTLVDGGVLYQISVGLENGKRKRIYFSADSVQNHPNLVGETFGGSTVKSASPRRYTKLSA